MSATMATTQRLAKVAIRSSTRPAWRSQYASFSSSKIRNDEKVQTPLQSQRKNNIDTPLRPAESTTIQTPVQRQDPSRVASAPAQTIRDPWPFYTLIGGLLAGSVFVYFYYEQRKAHMEQKWQNMLKEAQEKAQGKG